MFYDQDGNVCEPCLSCPNCYVEDIWYDFMCKAKKCEYAIERSDINDIQAGIQVSSKRETNEP
ncbi:MAG: hypothetical protein IIZ59_00315 [Clostridia bacterium]|nr:hypothetical protein [Clostridia bacterium]